MSASSTRMPTAGVYLWVFTLAAVSTLVLFGWKKWKIPAPDGSVPVTTAP